MVNNIIPPRNQNDHYVMNLTLAVDRAYFETNV